MKKFTQKTYKFTKLLETPVKIVVRPSKEYDVKFKVTVLFKNKQFCTAYNDKYNIGKTIFYWFRDLPIRNGYVHLRICIDRDTSKITSIKKFVYIQTTKTIGKTTIIQKYEDEKKYTDLEKIK